MAHPAVNDIDAIPDLRRVAEEVRDSRSPVRLRVAGQEVATILPASGVESPMSEQSDDEAFLSSLGGWKGLVDAERLKAESEASRGSDRPAVEL